MGKQVENSATEEGETVELLATCAEDYCRRALVVERLRALRGNTPAFDSKVWRELCDLGWPRIAAPEGVGGLELGAAAVGTVCRQLGRVAAPAPLLESGVLVSSLLGCLATTKACCDAAREFDALSPAAKLSSMVTGSRTPENDG